MHSSTPRAGSAVLGFLMCAAGVVGTWLTWKYFVNTTVGQRIDDTAFRGSDIGHTTLWRVAEPVLEIVSIPFIVVVLGAAALIALIRRRWLLALQVTILVGGANITTQLLKHGFLDRPDLADTAGAIDNSLPSGHTTVAASVAAALVLVVPRHTRPVVAILAAGYAAATGVATMVGGWHRPSDVVAALTVVMAWAGLTMIVTALGSPERIRPPDSPIVPTTVIGGLMLVVAFISGLLSASALQSTSEALTRTDTVTERGVLLEAYTGSALGVVAATAAIFAAILITHQFACRPAGPWAATAKSKDRVQSL